LTTSKKKKNLTKNLIF